MLSLSDLQLCLNSKVHYEYELIPLTDIDIIQSHVESLCEINRLKMEVAKLKMPTGDIVKFHCDTINALRERNKELMDCLQMVRKTYPIIDDKTYIKMLQITFPQVKE